MNKRAGLLLVPLIAVPLLLVWLAPDAGETMAAPGRQALPALPDAGAALSVASRAPARFTTGLEGMPRSLSDTEVDGDLEVDANGHLKITRGVRNVFDYFLSAMGEEPLETLLARVRAYLRHKLPAVAAAEAERLLDAYVAYRHGLASLPNSPQPGNGSVDLVAVRQQMQQVQALRQQYLPPEAIAAFFDDEDVYQRYTVARLEILQNTGLAPQARARQLAEAEQQLPPAMRETFAVITRVQNLEALTKDWQQRGGRPAELRQIRENLVGAEAADRLEVLDRNRAAWDQRMSAWYSARAALLGNPGLGEQDRQVQLNALRTQRFSADERLRVESLERLHDQG